MYIYLNMLISGNLRSTSKYKKTPLKQQWKRYNGEMTCQLDRLYSRAFVFFHILARWEQDTLRSVTSVPVTGRLKPVRASQTSIRVTGPGACGWCIMGPDHEPQQHHVQVLADDAHFRHANTKRQASHETISLPHFRTLGLSLTQTDHLTPCLGKHAILACSVHRVITDNILLFNLPNTGFHLPF